MIELRPFAKLGGADHSWLKARHLFSFASYFDPSNMGHGSLRVWNDDEIAPNTGFPAHPHANMEIITYVREGAITHQDSLGNQGRTEAGDVQVMSAGSGVRHSEYNLEPNLTKSSRSGSSRRRRAASLPGAQSRFRSRIGQENSSPSPAASRPTMTLCRSAPTRGCSPPR
jgi:redox-sensitive bicupin YhaK (pirin superfamily)